MNFRTDTPFDNLEAERANDSWIRRINLRGTIIGTISIFVGLCIWQGIAAIINNTLFFVGPLKVISAIPGVYRQGYWRDLGHSGEEWVLGILCSSVIGLVLGVAMGIVPLVRQIFQPWISAFYSTPLIALAPVIIIWFGIGIGGKIFFVGLIGFFPIVSNTEAGVRTTDPNLIEMAKSFGLTRLQIARSVYLRWSLPVVVAGFRLALSFGLIGVVVAELFGSSAGIGYLITQNTNLYNIAAVFVAVITLTIIGLFLSSVLRVVENRLRISAGIQ